MKQTYKVILPVSGIVEVEVTADNNPDNALANALFLAKDLNLIEHVEFNSLRVSNQSYIASASSEETKKTHYFSDTDLAQYGRNFKTPKPINDVNEYKSIDYAEFKELLEAYRNAKIIGFPEKILDKLLEKIERFLDRS